VTVGKKSWIGSRKFDTRFTLRVDWERIFFLPNSNNQCRLQRYVVSALDMVEKLEVQVLKISADTDELRDHLVSIALEWERVFGVAPSITSALSEYDAARLVGHSDESYGKTCVGRTAVSRGCDFIHDGVRYQIKANRPSGKPGSPVTKVGQAKNYEWDRLIWLLYDCSFVLQEAWEWEVSQYRAEFEGRPRLSPSDMRKGRRLR
jgi:hypothetical protein